MLVLESDFKVLSFTHQRMLILCAETASQWVEIATLQMYTYVFNKIDKFQIPIVDVLFHLWTPKHFETRPEEDER